MADEVIVVEPVIPVINVINQTPTITVSTPGPQGPSGAAASVFYTHIQSTPSAVWTVNHNLGGNPTAVVKDSAGTQCEGTFTYPTLNQMIITFSAAFSGTAYII